MSDLQVIGAALRRLDTRTHLTPARMELSYVADRWMAQIMADPLREALAGASLTADAAVHRLAVRVADLDWRRVRR